MKMQTNLKVIAALAVAMCGLQMAPAHAAEQSACAAAAGSARSAADAIIASATILPDDAAALMTCIFPLMPELQFRAAALTAAQGVKNAETGRFIIEVASDLLLKSTKRRVQPDRVTTTPPSSCTGATDPCASPSS